MSSPSSKIVPTKIPNITSLRDQLDYGNAGSKRCSTFNDDIRVFRKKFRTTDDIAGVDLHDWKNPAHQAGLTEMAQAYLDKGGNGSVFWPDDETSPYKNKYSYSTHRARIKRLVKQLFFRLNQQQYRNNKYKNKAKMVVQSPDDRASSTDTAIKIGPDSPTAAADPASPPPTILKPSTTATGSSGAKEPKDNGGSRHLPGNKAMAGTSREDVYEGPDSQKSSPPIRSFETIVQEMRSKRAYVEDDDATQRPTSSAKRQKRGAHDTAKENAAAACTDFTSPGKRTSARLKHVPKPHYSDWDNLDDLDGLTESDAVPEGSNTAAVHPAPSAGEAPVVDSSTNNTAAKTTDTLFHQARDGHLESRTSLFADAAPSLSKNPEAEERRNAPLADMNSARFEPMPSPAPSGAPPKEIIQGEDGPPIPTSPQDIKLAASGSSGKSSVSFIYRVVLSRSPEMVTERWTPRGRFQDKTLGGLIEELPFGPDVQGLIFTITGAGMKTREPIPRDDEDGLDSMKRYINGAIRTWFARQARLGDGAAPRLVLDILIEEMTDENRDGGDKLDDLELDW
ncbi:hypothetical protein NKR23_g10363 [Pleurostoma richardsiae]|uniref:Uncharacterized protein n=1 Tax=Pleurostoma richardsiae TaxID=41990 RepID=A0AA38RD29_9PEZI|nr:hypothetical protein NKR23_g10363 [Pleurostoma richardsiae]